MGQATLRDVRPSAGPKNQRANRCNGERPSVHGQKHELLRMPTLRRYVDAKGEGEAMNIIGLMLFAAGLVVLFVGLFGGTESQLSTNLTMMLWAVPAGAFAGRAIAEMMNR